MIRGLFRMVFGLVVLAALLVAGWIYRDPIRSIWHRARVEVEPRIATPLAMPPAPETSPELADEADRKLSGLAGGTRGHVALAEVEVQSLLRYRYAQLLPAFVDSLRIEFDGSRIRLRGRLPVDKLPRLGEAAALLPDTTEVTVTGQILPLEDGRIALAVDEVTAANIPLPRRFVPGALTRLGRRDEPGLPVDAVALPLPPGVGAAYVRNDSLVLLSRTAQRTSN
ncbi:MAG: hypothetical protein ACREMQ_02510 [Longimicrobiales bacterium]